MNAKQEAKLNMYRATQKHCNDNAATVATVPAFVTALNALNATVSAIISTAQQEDLVTKGVTIDKTEAKKALCSFATDIAAPIFAFASVNADNQLKQEVNFTWSDLFKTKDDLLPPRCQNIKDLGTANLPALAPYGLTAASLSAFQDAIDTYQQKVPAPRNSAAQKRALRQNLETLLQEADTILKEQMDKTLVGFKITDAGFVVTYKANRVIIDPGRSVTTLKGEIVNAMDAKPINGAVIFIEKTGHKTSTNTSGAYQIKPMPAGTYTLKISVTGFKEKTIEEVTVKKGQVTTLNAELESA